MLVAEEAEAYQTAAHAAHNPLFRPPHGVPVGIAPLRVGVKRGLPALAAAIASTQQEAGSRSGISE